MYSLRAVIAFAGWQSFADCKQSAGNTSLKIRSKVNLLERLELYKTFTHRNKLLFTK
jgi:hypothetical protein